MKTYKSHEKESLDKIYVTAIMCEVIYMLIFYPVGVFASWKRSVKLYGWFSTLALLGLIFQMILAYANRFEITIFLLRFAAFIYSRFLN